jgi:hypothetical protein
MVRYDRLQRLVDDDPDLSTSLPGSARSKLSGLPSSRTEVLDSG